MTESMKEKMAREVCRYLEEDCCQYLGRDFAGECFAGLYYGDLIDIILDVLMEPSAGMREAGSVGPEQDDPPKPVITTSQADAAFRAMIQAIKDNR